MRLHRALIAASLVFLSGCAHDVALQDIHYAVRASKQPYSVVTVIDGATLDSVHTVRSWFAMAAILETWDTKPGTMLKQVADFELPQMFAGYSFTTSRPNTLPDSTLGVELTLPDYTFEDFRAKVSVHAVAFVKGGRTLLAKTYTEEGDRQAAKIFWGGELGINPAIQASSLDAYKKVFAALRRDLEGAIGSAGNLLSHPAEASAPAAQSAGGSTMLAAEVRHGQFRLEAERVAKAQSCGTTPNAVLSAKGPGFEAYTVGCTNGDALSIRCDFGNCRVMK